MFASANQGGAGDSKVEKVHMHGKPRQTAFANQTAMHDELCTKGFNKCITPINIKFAKKKKRTEKKKRKRKKERIRRWGGVG